MRRPWTKSERRDGCLCALVLAGLFVAGMFASHAVWRMGEMAGQRPAVERTGEHQEPGGFGDAERSGKWRTVRNRYIAEHPVCAACGQTDNLNVHHVLPFKDYPEQELDPSNLITLCREHHFSIGHDADGPDGPLTPNWKTSNPDVRRDAQRARGEFSLAP